jgi:hypothetical protein
VDLSEMIKAELAAAAAKEYLAIMAATKEREVKRFTQAAALR